VNIIKKEEFEKMKKSEKSKIKNEVNKNNNK
jgi:hypothetical protein